MVSLTRLPTEADGGVPVDLGPITGLLQLIRDEHSPTAIWLFGSRARDPAVAQQSREKLRARGLARPDSDWDLLVVVPDAREADGVLEPGFGWTLSRRAGVPADVVFCTESDFCDGAVTVNTLVYEVVHCGGRLIEGQVP